MSGSGVFLQTDPIPGGSANAYDYCDQDPINCYDLNGQWGWHNIRHFAEKHWRAIAITLIVVGLSVALGPEVGLAYEAGEALIEGGAEDGAESAGSKLFSKEVAKWSAKGFRGIITRNQGLVGYGMAAAGAEIGRRHHQAW